MASSQDSPETSRSPDDAARRRQLLADRSDWAGTGERFRPWQSAHAMSATAGELDVAIALARPSVISDAKALPARCHFPRVARLCSMRLGFPQLKLAVLAARLDLGELAPPRRSDRPGRPVSASGRVRTPSRSARGGVGVQRRPELIWSPQGPLAPQNPVRPGARSVIESAKASCCAVSGNGNLCRPWRADCRPHG